MNTALLLVSGGGICGLCVFDGPENLAAIGTCEDAKTLPDRQTLRGCGRRRRSFLKNMSRVGTIR